jgi:NitT/TauT family transport system ATP-binding protein
MTGRRRSAGSAGWTGIGDTAAAASFRSFRAEGAGSARTENAESTESTENAEAAGGAEATEGVGSSRAAGPAGPDGLDADADHDDLDSTGSAADAGLLEIAGLSYAYPGSGGDVLSAITLGVREGEFVSVVGPSGCGKSTLLSAVAGLVTGYRGSIRFRGGPVERPHPGIGVVFQEDATFPWRTALRNVEFGLEMRGIGKAERRRKATEMLQMVGLEKFANYYPNQLSGGMKQRVAIARTLVTGPALLLMDEPFGALDEQTRMLLGEELLRIQQELRQTVLFVTHSIQESIMLSDRIALMSSSPGRIKDVVSVPFTRPRSPDLISTPEFGALTARVWNTIREESLRIGFSPIEELSKKALRRTDQMKGFRVMLGMGCAALAVSVIACSNPTSTTASSTTPSTAASSSGSAVAMAPLNLIVPDPGNFTSGMPVYVAIAQGFFKQQHLNVTVVPTQGGATNVQAVIAGKGAIGVDTGPVSVMSADLHGADLKILGADTTGMDILFFSKSSGPIKTIYDLAGKKVGYSSPGSSSEVALDQVNQMIKAKGLTPATGVPLGGPPAELTGVDTGQVSAGFTAAPNLFAQIDSGQLRLLTSLASYPAYKDVAVRVIFASGSFISSHPTEVQEFLTAWEEAWAYAFANHTQAMTDWQQGAKLPETPSVLATGFDYYTATTQALYPISGLQRDVSDAVSLGVLKAPLTTSQLNADVDTQFDRSAMNAAG